MLQCDIVFNQTPMAAQRNYSTKGKLLRYLILYGWKGVVYWRKAGIVNVFWYADLILPLYRFFVHICECTSQAFQT